MRKQNKKKKEKKHKRNACLLWHWAKAFHTESNCDTNHSNCAFLFVFFFCFFYFLFNIVARVDIIDDRFYFFFSLLNHNLDSNMIRNYKGTKAMCEHSVLG